MSSSTELAKVNSYIAFYKNYFPCGLKKKTTRQELSREKTYRVAGLLMREQIFLLSLFLREKKFTDWVMTGFSTGFCAGIAKEFALPSNISFSDDILMWIESRAVLKNWARVIVYTQDVGIMAGHLYLTITKADQFAQLNGFRVGFYFGYYAGSCLMKFDGGIGVD